jgi:4-hydroxybenzoate polyprenyltransferase
LSHSVFALPFALLALLTASHGAPGVPVLLLVIGAVVAARTAAMAYNRLADREIDAANPRTAGREIPRGAVSPKAALGLTAVAGAVFLACCWGLGPVCAAMGVPTLAWLLAYSHIKRISWLCHVWLGVALGLAPIAAWVAAEGDFTWRTLQAVVLGAGVTAWVAGFDVLYACQDEAFDRERGLHSIPARFGAAAAMWGSRLLHVGAAAAFVWFGLITGLDGAFLVGVGLSVLLLVWQHRLLRPDDLSRIDMAFFTANGTIAVVLLLFGCIDLYLL